MGKKKIIEELVIEFIRLHQAGESYRAIGKKHDVDPRTVKSWVEKAGLAKEKEHWEIVSRQVDAEYLHEHYRLLIGIAAKLPDAMHANPLDFNSKQDAESLIDESVRLGLQHSANLLKERGIGVTENLSRRLLKALLEHEPWIKLALDRWKYNWDRFQEERRELADQARGLFIQKNLRHEVAETLGIAVAVEGMGIKLLGEDARTSRVEPINDERSRLNRSNKQTSEEVYKGPKHEVEAAINAYEFVLSQISHEERIRPMLDAYNSLKLSEQKAEDLVERLVLISRPQGQCSLCPGRLE